MKTTSCKHTCGMDPNSLAWSYGVARFRDSKPIETNRCCQSSAPEARASGETSSERQDLLPSILPFHGTYH